MPSLILDTSTQLILLAVFDKGKLLASLEIPHQNELSGILLSKIKTILADNKLTNHDLDSIFVGIGPGSYTGTRIASITAKTLAFACNLPLLSFYSPLAFIPPEAPDGPFHFIVEAKHTPNFILQGFLQKGQINDPISYSFTSDKNFSPSVISFSFNPDYYLAKPNLARLATYLDTTDKQKLPPVKIIYLHNP